MTAINQYVSHGMPFSRTPLLKWTLGALSLLLLVYLVWSLCGIGYGLFSFVCAQA